MVKCRKIVLARHFQAIPDRHDFQIIEEDVPDQLQNGEFMVEARYFSVDPYVRNKCKFLPLGSTVVGFQMGIVTKTRNGQYPLGTRLTGHWGWRTHTIVNPEDGTQEDNRLIFPFPELDDCFSPSLSLGALGMPGNTAYFGFLEICQPKAGDVVVISGAAGAVGSLVGQIAKIKGCFVIGFAGSDDKVKWLLNELHFDKVFNYKTDDWDKSLEEAAPEGIDCYFDNVGGKFSAVVRNYMKNLGRIAVCGYASLHSEESSTSAHLESILVSKQLKMEGFLYHRWLSRWFEGVHQMLQWIKEDRIKVRETVTEGFDNIPEAFIGMLRGDNFGKTVIKV